jgi:hypothetical protein
MIPDERANDMVCEEALLAEGLKDGNQIVDQVCHLMDRFDNRLTLNDGRLVDRYLKRELHLLVYFSTRMINEEFVACFQREHAVGWPDEDGEGRIIPTSHAPELLRQVSPKIDALKVRAGRKQQAVLVDTVKLVEFPKRVVSSVVWFDRVYGIYSVLPHALCMSVFTRLVFRG